MITLLFACVNPDGHDTGTVLPESWVDVGFSAEDTEDLSELVVAVADVVLEGDGPGGPVSVSYSAYTVLDLLNADGRVARLALDAGRYDTIHLDVLLDRRGDQWGIEAAGELDGRAWRLLAEDVHLDASLDELEVPEQGGAALEWVLRVDAWLDGVELPEGDDDEEDEVEVLISPTSNQDLYAEILARLDDTSRLEVLDPSDEPSGDRGAPGEDAD